MRGPLAFVALLMLALLAGCAGNTDPATEEQQRAEETGISEVPEWQVGDYWSYDSPIGEATYVVTEVSAGDYLVETDSQGSAYYEAKHDSAFQGLIRKSDLAGSEDGRRVDMFDWPLEPNKRWTTTWDDEPLHMFADPMGEGQYHVMGHRQDDDQMVVEYHYTAAVGWFEYIVFYNETGEETWRLDLNDHGEGFSGTVYRYAIGATHELSATTQDSGYRTQPVEAQWNELGVTLRATCPEGGAGQVLIGLNGPGGEDGAPMLPAANEPDHGMTHDCQAGPTGQDEFVTANPGGDWEVGFVVAAPDGAGHVSIEERSLQQLPM